MSLLNESLHSVTAFAPATCANVGVGFDVLGFAFDRVGDTVKLTKRLDQQIVIESINAQDKLPLEVDKNTASVVVKALCQRLGLTTGFSIDITKGIALSSGMGGSAASAVAALLACNQFLSNPLSLIELADLALLGEKAACGEAHADNIVPCLYGGLTLIQSKKPLRVLTLPMPKIYCVLVHPEMQISTRDARKVLGATVPFKDFVAQTANFAAFISALYTGDKFMLQQVMHDLIIEPQRAHFLPDFYKIKAAAMDAGAIAMSFSGSGPTVFAWANELVEATRIATAMTAVLKKNGLDAQHWIGKIAERGAFVIAEEMHHAL